VLGAAVTAVQSGVIGDADGDGVPDDIDVCCGTPLGVSVDAAGRPLGDLDDDCDVDLADHAILAANLFGPAAFPHDGDPCDDRDACTTDDHWECGVCVATPVDCDDGNDCTDDYCDALAGCVHRSMAGAQCDDGDPCTVDDVCRDDMCVGSANPCEDDLTCTENVCSIDGEQIVCTANVIPRTCLIGGMCYGDGDPRPGNPCSECNSSASPSDWTDVAEGTRCNDGLVCTSNDMCDGRGTCTGDLSGCSAMECEDPICNASGGCDVRLKAGWCRIDGTCYLDGAPHRTEPCLVCDAGNAPESWTVRTGGCDDGVDCTFDDVCRDGVCRGTGYSCDDQLVCTRDKCVGDGTCRNDYDPNSGYCLIDRTCVEYRAIDPATECKFCDAPATTWSNLPAGTPCIDDGDPRTRDICDGRGTCTHVP